MVGRPRVVCIPCTTALVWSSNFSALTDLTHPSCEQVHRPKRMYIVIVVSYLSFLNWLWKFLTLTVRRLGATWWKNGKRVDLLRRELNGLKDSDEYIRVGWPAGGGVWVLHNFRGSNQERSQIDFNAYNMEERCKVIEQIGGIFYADPKDCRPCLDLS